jgi:nucleotide-binding universal stress UspA family protein
VLDRVLVPLDGSETAERVLPHLRRFLIGRPGAEILILRVLDATSPDVSVMAPAIQAEAERYVRRVTFQFVNEGRQARSLIRAGGAAATILRVAREEKVSLTVLSTHGRTGLPRLVLGSVAETVLRSSPSPVFLVRSFTPGLDVPSRGKTESTPFHAVLVPLDGSELSLRVMPLVLDLVRPLDARAILLYVHEPPGPNPHWLIPERPLEDVERQLREHTVPVTTAIREGDPATEILAAARTNAADLLVMATHGRSGPVRWLFGSVTESVLRSAEIPMLVVPARAPAEVHAQGENDSMRHPA